MNKEDRKNLRTFLIKESLNPSKFTPKRNLFNKSQKINQYTSFDYSKTKEKKEEKQKSSNIVIKNNYMTLFINDNKGLFVDNDRHENSEEVKFPKINNLTNNTTENNAYSNINYYKDHLIHIKKKNNKKNFFLSDKKSLFNSFDKRKGQKKNISFKYIRLNEFFPKNLKKDLIKFNSTKSCIKEKSVRIKLENNKEYNDYINNKLRINYNKNYDSSFTHKFNSDFMIDNIERKNKIILNNTKQYRYTTKNDEFITEEKDKIDEKNLGKIKIFNKIRNYLINQYKKYVIGKEVKKFFSNIENKINFLNDINLLPNLKSNLVKQTLNTNKLDQINFIEHNTLRYLNIAKINIQRQKDYKNTFEYLEEQIAQKKIDELDIELDKNYTEKYDLFDMENYITKKNINQNDVKIFNDKNKILFYKTFMKLHDKMKPKIDE